MKRVGELMRNIVCYRRDCNQLATWTIPGHPPIHICTECLRKLQSGEEPVRLETHVGPTEFKENPDDSTSHTAF